MSNKESGPDSHQESLQERIQSLEQRLHNIESILRIEWKAENEGLLTRSPSEEYSSEKTEFKVTEYGLAWLGTIVFVFGIIFLMTYTENLGFPIFSKVIAYVATFILIATSYFIRKSFPILANVLTICSLLLLFFITVRLHFFIEQPLIVQKEIAISLLFILIGAQFYVAIKKNSEFLASVAITFCTITALFSNSSYLTFSILTITALCSLVLFYYKVWWKSLIFSLFMIYIAHLLWLFGNPIMNHTLGIVELPQHNILFLVGYAIIYSISIFIPKKKIESNGALISITIWNVLFFSLLLSLIIPSFYKENYMLIFSAIAFFNLLFAIILKVRSIRDFAPATYASISFMAISIAVYGYTGLPNAYFLLSLQSFLVVSMALWFRSRLIVVANAFLFVSILLIYLITSESIDIINFTFAFTAMATARILNWQQEQLTLKTDGFRNIYLSITFFMVLYSLSQALPSNYITLAWTGAAIIFFLLSILLKKIKYRYLAILTIIVTGGHLFFIDLGQMEMGYKVIAFLVFAIISLGLSIYYTKRIRNH